MTFMPSIWTLIAGVSVVAILSAFQWWLSGHARRFARMHLSTARSFREPLPSGMVARSRPRPPPASNLARKPPSKKSALRRRRSQGREKDHGSAACVMGRAWPAVSRRPTARHLEELGARRPWRAARMRAFHRRRSARRPAREIIGVPLI